MAVAARVLRAAEEVLDALGSSKLPINVRKAALIHAHVQSDRMPDDVSGMLIPAPAGLSKRWVIAVNNRHPPSRQRFTLAHELGHVLLHQFTTAHADGLQQVYYRNQESSSGLDREEVEANQFAAELLMPARMLVPLLRDAGISSWAEGTEPRSPRDRLRRPQEEPGFALVVEDLAWKFGVSVEAMVVRIGTLVQAT